MRYFGATMNDKGARMRPCRLLMTVGDQLEKKLSVYGPL